MVILNSLKYFKNELGVNLVQDKFSTHVYTLKKDPTTTRSFSSSANLKDSSSLGNQYNKSRRMQFLIIVLAPERAIPPEEISTEVRKQIKVSVSKANEKKIANNQAASEK